MPPVAPSQPDRGLVLVIEDEPAIADVERLYLSRAGFGVHVEHDGTAGLAAIRRLHPVAVVLDVGLPGVDGVDICRSLRADGDTTPLLFVTARDDEVDRILGLELGADDYVTKPFSPRELVARVRAVLRRGPLSGGPGDRPGPARPTPLEIGPVSIDPAARRVRVHPVDSAGTALEPDLTATEFDLLAELVRHRGQVLTREQLLARVWGYEAAAGSRTVDAHLAALRAKLGPGAAVLRTVRGVGYAADDPGPGGRS